VPRFLFAGLAKVIVGFLEGLSVAGAPVGAGRRTGRAGMEASLLSWSSVAERALRRVVTMAGGYCDVDRRWIFLPLWVFRGQSMSKLKSVSATMERLWGLESCDGTPKHALNMNVWLAWGFGRAPPCRKLKLHAPQRRMQPRSESSTQQIGEKKKDDALW
jgi:hypothetical protein